MAMTVCAQCGLTLRPDAKFCASCGAPAQAAPSSVGAPTKIVSSAPPPPASGPGQTTSATASALPAARQVAVKTWTGSRKAATGLAWLVTAGGRAAYTEIARPDPTLEGRVTGSPAERSIKTPIEPAALVFLAVLLFGWLALLLPRVYALSVLIATLLLLIVLVYVGGRRPFFSRLTLAGAVDRLTRRGAQAPYYRFDVKSPHDPQPVQVVLVGQRLPGDFQRH